MKTKKIFFIAFSLAILIGIAGCAPNDTGLNTNTDRLTTQTRINRNRNWNINNDNDFGDLDGGFDVRDTRNNNNTNLNNGMVRRNGTNNQNNLNNNQNTTANDLARKIATLPEVRNASVVLNNDTCLVGVELDNNTTTTANISSALRNKIEDMVEDSTNVDSEDISITADPNLLTRIQSLSQRMTTNVGNTVGNDVRDFTDDIEDIIRAIVPGNGNGNRNTINNR